MTARAAEKRERERERGKFNPAGAKRWRSKENKEKKRERERIDMAVTLSFGDHQQIALGHRLSASGSQSALVHALLVGFNFTSKWRWSDTVTRGVTVAVKGAAKGPNSHLSRWSTSGNTFRHLIVIKHCAQSTSHQGHFLLLSWLSSHYVLDHISVCVPLVNSFTLCQCSFGTMRCLLAFSFSSFFPPFIWLTVR